MLPARVTVGVCKASEPVKLRVRLSPDLACFGSDPVEDRLTELRVGAVFSASVVAVTGADVMFASGSMNHA